jgi:hypothetical protein
MKEKIKVLTQNLMESALSRGSEQGILVFRKILELLDQSDSQDETFRVLQQLNNALVGIEAHGYLTPEEFLWVKELREIEDTAV